jgi:hypothetical protein
VRRLMTPDLAIDGGYLIDSALNQMTDDGCPVVPDRSTEQIEPDNPPSGRPPQTKTRWQRLCEVVELRDRWRTFCERMVRSDEMRCACNTPKPVVNSWFSDRLPCATDFLTPDGRSNFLLPTGP